MSDSKEHRERFLLNPENMLKHQVHDPNSLGYKIAYAWVMETSVKYEPELQYTPVPGPLWPKLTSDIQKKICNKRAHGKTQSAAAKRQRQEARSSE